MSFLNPPAPNRNYEKELGALKKAAENDNALAQCELGKLYYFGRIVQESIDEAIRLWKLSAKQGNQEASNCLQQWVPRYYQSHRTTSSYQSSKSSSDDWSERTDLRIGDANNWFGDTWKHLKQD